MKVVFLGSDSYSLIVLQALEKDRRLEIVKVVNDKKRLDEIKSLSKRPDVGILASFGAIIPKEILDFPQKGILNIHPSLLPSYRGASPVQFTILNGERETGVTIIKIDEKVDHGPIVAQTKEEVKPDDTAKSLYERLFTIGAQVLLTILPAYLEGRIELREQNHRKATYARKLTRDDGKIDWSKPDSFNERFIRAMYPWPGAFTNVKLKSAENRVPSESKNEKLTKRLKILKAHLENGKLVLDLVQLEGKKPVSWQEFKRGYSGAKITF